MKNKNNDFQSAIQAIISGDTETLKGLLKNNPDLIRLRSSNDHKAMLIHYVSANGVEDEFQKTPSNAVAIANILLDADADINATFLDGGSGTTPLVSLVTSFHPHKAGVAAELVETFIRAGAPVDGINEDGQPLKCALSSEYPESVEALLKCGAQIKSLEIAAGVGELRLVEDFVQGKDVSKEDLEEAYLSACKYGHTDVVRYLLEQNLDVDLKGWANNTGLMLAAQRGRTEAVRLLLEHNASVELKSDFGATALRSAIYFLHNHAVPDADYPGVVDLLLNAGSPFNGSATRNDNVNAILRKHGLI